LSGIAIKYTLIDVVVFDYMPFPTIVSMVYNVIKRLKKNRVPCEGNRAAELQKYGG